MRSTKSTNLDVISQIVKEPEESEVQHMLLKFIHHNQPQEFIDVYKMYKAKEDENVRMEVDFHLETIGKTFLHLAVEHKAARVVQFLLFENSDDPNVLTHN